MNKHMNDLTHPTIDTLIDFIENSLDDEIRVQVVKHINQPCLSCQNTIDYLTDIILLFNDEPLFNPPNSVVKITEKFFKRLQNRDLDEFPILIARLIFDSFATPRVAFVRGIDQERQLLYKVEGYDIDLQISKGDTKGIHLIGQILPENDSVETIKDGAAWLQLDEHQVAITTTDELGMFELESDYVGDYDLIVELNQVEIWIPLLTG